ncbi:anthranilate phosphoribosyltransferase [Sporanaerobium hydrogeniformans]|uniref:Anthranilate phosphoribosyltransferase n=1 Tax=Sporanaerobium hydrogeniformans TaxID=3072179 RepID=A0AC61DBP7_9FIRM|nr:anthranilate phosphoribosyltransferase [Sporanaerobium hydrogeniformans]PHV70225.1 anthranilate phosphoribosyltransferase [Sporanaerobium hydrogeniformans]
MMNNYIKKVIEGQNLTIEEAAAAMEELMSGEATDAQIASYLTALRMKGESIEEITGSAKGMREKCLKLKTEGDVLDIVGTGGDGTNTFNISSVSSLVIAAAGVPVAKHGNRSVSSKCGSADVLEALGVKLELTKEQNEEVLKRTGICFMFAPVYHSAMKYVGKARREIGVRTIFNILGPLANPAYANLQVMGVYSEELVEPLAKVLCNLGVKRAIVVHGEDGVDEVSICGKTKVSEVRDGVVKSYTINPLDLGLTMAKPEEIKGGQVGENKAIALAILKGEKGAKRDIVLLNSAMALYIALDNKSLTECIQLAAEMIDSGKALAKLQEFVETTQSFASIAI